MTIDVLFVAYNRLEFTVQSFEALKTNTDWSLVRQLVVHDDGSRDGTREYLRDQQHAWKQQPARDDGDEPTDFIMFTNRVRGPVAVMNHYLREAADGADAFAKVDNDFVMSPGWLNALAAVLDVNPELDIVGTEPGILLDVAAQGHPALVQDTWVPLVDGDFAFGRAEYRYRPCEHIGGKGLMRVSAFDGRPMKPHGRNGYYGFTEWQVQHPEVREGWIDPDLQCFGLDQLPLEPWASLTERYVKNDWGRFWSKYSWDAEPYWAWWTPVAR